MTDTLPRTWFATLFDPRNVVFLDWVQRGDDRLDAGERIKREAALSNVFHIFHKPIAEEDLPEFFYFEKSAPEAKKANLPDLFFASGGLTVISKRFRDLLLGFDMGANQIVEIPLHDIDRTTPRPDRVFLLNRCEAKRTVLHELSDGIKPIDRPEAGIKARIPGACRATPTSGAALAARASAAEGADLWHDPLMYHFFFLSGRLKRAIKAAKTRARSLPIKPCTVHRPC